MTTSQQRPPPTKKANKPTQRADWPLISLRELVLISAALVVAVAAVACLRFHLQWLIFGVGVFAAALAYLNRIVK